MRSLGKKVLVGTGMLVCPCHMPLVLPLLATALSGTAVGVWLSANMGLMFLLTTVYFLIAMVVGIHWIIRMPIVNSTTSIKPTWPSTVVQPAVACKPATTEPPVVVTD